MWLLHSKQEGEASRERNEENLSEHFKGDEPMINKREDDDFDELDPEAELEALKEAERAYLEAGGDLAYSEGDGEEEILEPGADDDPDAGVDTPSQEELDRVYYEDTVLEVKSRVGDSFGAFLGLPFVFRSWNKRRCADWLREIFLVAPAEETKNDRESRLTERHFELYGWKTDGPGGGL